MSEQTTRSAWPDPPNYYKRYTDENLELLKEAKEKNQFPKEPITLPSIPEFYLESLEPPQPPTSEYTVFDQKWQIQDQLPTLSELGVKQLFKEGDIDRVQELKRLNRILITQFLQLLETLVNNPEEVKEMCVNITNAPYALNIVWKVYRKY